MKQSSGMRALATIGLMVGGMLGRFGDVGPRKEYDGQQVQGVMKFKKGTKTKRPTKQAQRARSGHGKGHRRRYLCGKPAFRTL